MSSTGTVPRSYSVTVRVWQLGADDLESVHAHLGELTKLESVWGGLTKEKKLLPHLKLTKTLEKLTSYRKEEARGLIRTPLSNECTQKYKNIAEVFTQEENITCSSQKNLPF